ncbi:MAG: glutathione S-transferase [Thermosynechococcaceae cyanobacterium]
MLTVHHLNNSRSQRILWLLEELELKYNIKRYERDPETLLAPDSLRKIHPLGKSPVVTDGELTLAESGAIVEYLVNSYGDGSLIPAEDTPEKRRYTYWLHYAEGSAMPPLVMKLVLGQVEKKAMFLLRPLAKAVTGQIKSAFAEPQIKLHLGYMENELAKTTWFAGDEFTAADIQMSFPIEAASTEPDFSVNYKKLLAFLDRIHSRPAYQKALERGGEYQVLS